MNKKMLKADLIKEVERKEEVIVKVTEDRNKLADLLAEAKATIEDAKLNQDDNVYDSGEQKFIKFYQVGFFVLLGLHLLRFLF